MRVLECLFLPLVVTKPLAVFTSACTIVLSQEHYIAFINNTTKLTLFFSVI